MFRFMTTDYNTYTTSKPPVFTYNDHLSESACSDLFEFLQKNPQYTTLDLRTNTHKQTIIFLLIRLRANTSITSLAINFNVADENTNKLIKSDFMELLTINHTITALTIKGNITPLVAKSIIDDKFLTCLDLTECQAEPALIAEIIAKTQLTEITLVNPNDEIITAIANNGHIKKVNLSNSTTLNDSHAAQLATSTSITSLDLSNCQLNDQFVAKLVKSNSITDLKLGKNQFSSQSALELAQNYIIKELNVEQNDGVDDQFALFLAPNTTLEILHLSGCHSITDTGAYTLGNSTIRMIDITLIPNENSKLSKTCRDYLSNRLQSTIAIPDGALSPTYLAIATVIRNAVNATPKASISTSRHALTPPSTPVSSAVTTVNEPNNSLSLQ